MVNYVLKKGDKFWPSKEMKKIAWVTDPKIYEKAAKDPIKFWEDLAHEGIVWDRVWSKTYEEKLPYFNWFKGGKLNLCFNALDRHLDTPNKPALIWVPESMDKKKTKDNTLRPSPDKIHHQRQ